MVYKIGLCSTHGTGKSALAASIEGELKKRGIESKHLEESATEAKELGLEINENTNLSAQLYILHRQCANEIIFSEKRINHPNYEVIICDRTSLDNYCYLERKLGRNKYALDLSLGHVKNYPYNRIYVLPIVDPEIDIGTGTRSLDKIFQSEMDSKIREFLREYKIANIELKVPYATDHFRAEWTKTIINQTLKDLEKNKEIKFDKKYYF